MSLVGLVVALVILIVLLWVLQQFGFLGDHTIRLR
jgi:uncharacterized protein HemY